LPAKSRGAKVDLSEVADSNGYKAYLPAFTVFASTLFDAEAEAALDDWITVDLYESFLQTDLAPRIIKGVLPDRGVAAARLNGRRK